MDDTSSGINPYCEIIVNKGEKDNMILSQMEQWSILTNMVNYILYNKHPENFHSLDIRTTDQKNYKKINKKEEERQIVELDFGDMPEKLKGEYLDRNEVIHSKVISTTRFNENTDLSTTYLGKTNMSRVNKIKAEERFPIPVQGYTVGKLLDGTEYQILLDTGASKSLCPSHIIYVANPYIYYQNLHLKCREFK